MPKPLRRSVVLATRARPRRGTVRKTATRRHAPPDPLDPLDNEAHIDGCDVDFNESDITPDEELPASRGGVEVVRGARRRPARQRR